MTQINGTMPKDGMTPKNGMMDNATFMQKTSTLVSKNRRFIPLAATITLFFLAYGIGAYLYEGMRDPQVFLNLFKNSPFYLISAVGMTFVILTGGIDLSVSGMVALTSVAAAALIRDGWNVWLVFLLMLLMGSTLGAIMGSFITYMKVQPFIATLAGMWFARGMCFFISDDAIPVSHRIYRILGETKILIPGLSNPETQTGASISILAVVAMLVWIVAVYVAQYTRFGRTVYAIGGNEQSARLMGLSVNRTKMMVYTLSGFLSALAGIVYGIYVASGHGLYAQGYELTIIASVVMGGTMLSGGTGYMFGTLFGVLILGVTQLLIQFNGRLSSWWTNIVIGGLTLIFISVQSLLASRKGGRRRTRTVSGQAAMLERRKRRLWLYGGAAVVVLLLAVLFFNGFQNRQSSAATGAGTPGSAGCQLKPYRQDQAALLMEGGALIAYERNGGPECIDELFAVYPDGRIVGDDGEKKIEKQVTPDELEKLLADIKNRGWFTDGIYNTWHTPCGQCFGYYLTVRDQDVEKTVKAVDGGTDAPADYWQVVSILNGILPKFTSP